MDILKECAQDTLKVSKISSITAIFLVLAAVIVEILINGLKIDKILEGIRGSLFISGSLGLFLTGFFIIKNNESAKFKYEIQWKNKFNCLNFAAVLLLFSSILIVYGTVFDFLLYNYKLK